MNPNAERRNALEDIAADGVEEAEADIFKEFPAPPRTHAPHLCLCRMGMTCPNKHSCPCVAGRSQCNGTASNRKGT
jgi:hypothetical protein